MLQFQMNPQSPLAFSHLFLEELEQRTVPAINLSVLDSSVTINVQSTQSPEIRFDVVRSGDTTSSVEVDYSTRSGSATPWVDYLPERGTVVFASGVTQQTVSVDILFNVGAASSFFLALSDARVTDLSNSEIFITDSIATGSILYVTSGIGSQFTTISTTRAVTPAELEQPNSLPAPGDRQDGMVRINNPDSQGNPSSDSVPSLFSNGGNTGNLTTATFSAPLVQASMRTDQPVKVQLQTPNSSNLLLGLNPQNRAGIVNEAPRTTGQITTGPQEGGSGPPSLFAESSPAPGTDTPIDRFYLEAIAESSDILDEAFRELSRGVAELNEGTVEKKAEGDAPERSVPECGASLDATEAQEVPEAVERDSFPVVVDLWSIFVGDAAAPHRVSSEGK